jgi:hypothetical protein
LQKLETSNLEPYNILKELIKNKTNHKGTTVQLQQDPGFDSTADPSHRKSSVASTGAQDDAHVDEAPIDL